MKLCYPWHPLYGQVLTVFCGRNQAYEPSYYCRVEEHRPGIRFAVPQWMFDAAVCAKTRLRNEPLVSWQVLEALKQLLEETSQSVVVQHRYSTPVKGTLFLDEIGELPLHLQPKLLRALESGQITPVGSDVPVSIDTRLIAATNRDLSKEVVEGRFRDDLYYRINVVELVVPPLSERQDDILPLARHFAMEFAGALVRLSPQTVQCLLAYRWPGNVRELRNAIQRSCLLCRGDVVLPEHLPPKIAALAMGDAAVKAGRLSQVERATILATLNECNGNRTQAAKKLGIGRRSLIYKLHAIEDDPK